MKLNKITPEKNSDGGWKYPFIFLLIILVGAIVGMYIFVQKVLKKMHLP
jgi:hypothetical protein